MRKGIDRGHLEDAAGSWLLLTPNACRKKGDQFAGLPESFHGLGSLVDLEARDGRLGFLFHDVQYRNRLAGLVKFLAGAEGLEKRLAHVKFFGNRLARAGAV